MRVFISTVMSMWNDRYETTCRWVSPDLSMGSVRFINGFAQHIQWFRSIFSLISRNVHLVMVFLYQWFGTNNGYISQLCCTLIG